MLGKRASITRSKGENDVLSRVIKAGEEQHILREILIRLTGRIEQCVTNNVLRYYYYCVISRAKCGTRTQMNYKSCGS